MIHRLVSLCVLCFFSVSAQHSGSSENTSERVRIGKTEALFKQGPTQSEVPPASTELRQQEQSNRSTRATHLPLGSLSERNPLIIQQYSEITAAARQRSASVIFVVTDPSDEPDSDLTDNIFSPQTLRSAIQNANKTAGLDAISFSGITTIKPLTDLPVATTPVIIDGSVSGGKLVLDGSLMTNKNGLLIIGSSTVKNMIFTNWGSAALALAINTGAGNNIIQSCEFYHNKGVGININSDNNLIGGLDPSERNIVYDNVYNPSNFRTGYGIAIINGDNNIVVNNYIGTPDGVTASPNDNGLGVEGLKNKVYQNLISGNVYGLYLEGDFTAFGTNGNLIENNLIGTTASGMSRLPNNIGLNFTDAIGDTIRSNIVSGNSLGIYCGSGASKRMHIHSNAVGFNIDRSDTLSNKSDGISVRGDFHLIEKNVVSGNGGNGISLVDGDSSIVRNNLIGTDTSGRFPRGNRLSGIVLELAKGVRVGGNSFADANIIAANGEAGVKIHFSSGSIITSGNRVIYNYIGTNALNDTGLGNLNGVSVLRNAPRNIIESNVIARNKRHGIFLYRFVQTGDSTFIRKNFIGTDASALLSMGNDSAGVMIEEGNGNIVGGENPSDGNTIMYNGTDGVTVKKGAGNSILSNTIKKNKQLSIDIGEDGPTENDSADIDSGANGLQNFPVITFIKVTGGNTSVYGILNGVPLKAYKIQFYTHEKPDSTGFGEGEEYQKTETVMTDSAGRAQFTTTISDVHRRVVATATDIHGSTSEFSKSPIIVNSVGDASDLNPADGYADTGGPAVDGAPEVTLRAAIQTANQLAGADYISFDIPGTQPFFILPQSSFPVVLSDITIDGSTEDGYDPKAVQAIRLMGTNAGANTDGLNLAGERSAVRAIYLSQFQGDGIEMSGERLMLTDITSNANKRSGVHSSGDVTLDGNSTFNGNGPAALTSAQCNTLTTAGLWVGGWLRGKGTVTANSNCGPGIRHDGGSEFISSEIDLHADITASNNSAGGIFGSDNTRLTGTKFDFSHNGSPENPASGVYLGGGDLMIETSSGGESPSITVNGNSDIGIYAASGSVTLNGKAQVNNNGLGRSSLECFNGEIDGIQCEGTLTAQTLEVIGNGFDGIRTHGSCIINGDLTVKDHPGRGVWATFNIHLNGTEHTIDNNGDQAMWAANGWIRVEGMLKVRNNRINGTHGIENAPKETDSRIGSVQAWNNIILDDVEVVNNEPTGISGWDNVWIKGSVTAKNNSVGGIFAMDELRIDGAQNTISGNGGDGLATNNRGIFVNGSVTIEGNGKDASIVSVENGGFGAIAQFLQFNDVHAGGNAKTGLLGHNGITIRGRGIIRANGGDGLASNKFVQISGGRIIENEGYGIESPIVRISGTQVGNNGLGGISGTISGTTAALSKSSYVPDAASLPPPESFIRGSVITGNNGNGITAASKLPFIIEGSNISGNTAFSISNTGSGVVIANGNWWGNATGPGAALNGSVTASQWRSSAVGVFAGISAETLFVRSGETDSLSMVAANWSDLSDSLSVSASDSKGWLTTVTGRILSQRDSTPAVSSLKYHIPENAAPGDSSRIILTAVSLAPSSETMNDTIHLVVYVPLLHRVIMVKDTVRVSFGDTLRMSAAGFDQSGREQAVNLLWNATGGSISPSGYFTTGSDSGFFIITATDSSSGISDTAVVHILGPHSAGAASEIVLSTALLKSAPIAPGTEISMNLQITNGSTRILRIDSLKTGTAYFTAVRSPNVQQLRLGDTLSVIITFSPDSNRFYPDTLRIYNNSPASPAVVILRGNDPTTGAGIVENTIPDEYILQQNYPNPFNPSTTIRFGLPVTVKVSVRIYDVLGREVSVLVNEERNAGTYTVPFNAGALSSGVYFCRMTAGYFTSIRKLLLQK
jgi:parallel beta-helix repeat protein